jgi:hypothetical protein
MYHQRLSDIDMIQKVLFRLHISVLILVSPQERGPWFEIDTRLTTLKSVVYNLHNQRKWADAEASHLNS